MAFSVVAITSEAAVSCNSVLSNVPHRIKAHASTIANGPKRRARSSVKAMNRSPSLAKRYRALVQTGGEPAAVVVATASAGFVSPHSSKRYWPEGIAPPQRLQCFVCELIWPWQCGHSIFLRSPDRLFVKNTPASAGRRITEGQRSSGHCPVGTTETKAIRDLEYSGLLIGRAT